MSEGFVIPLGEAGLVKADFGFLARKNGYPDNAVAAAMTLTETASSDYAAADLPDRGQGVWETITWEYPAGVYASYVYPEQAGPPPSVVIPSREAGLVKADFDLALYRNNASQSIADLTVTAITGGDYRVEGWPMDLSGQWLLVWRRDGVSSYYAWSSTGASTATPGYGVLAEIAAGAAEVFAAMGDMTKMTLRRYRTGVTPTTFVSGAQARHPVGQPAQVQGILARRTGRDSAGTATVWLWPTSINEAGVALTNPADEWTIQEAGGDERPLVSPWSPFGPEAEPVLWRGTIQSGGEHPRV